MGDSNTSAMCRDLGRVSSWVMTRVLYSVMHPGLVSLIKGLSILAFYSWVKNGCPGKDLGIIWPTVHHSPSSTPSGSTSYLLSLIAIFGFAGALQVGPFMLSEWVMLTAYPLLSSSPLPPAAWPMFRNVCFQKADTHFSFASASSWSMGIICKKGPASAYKYIQKSFERHINPCISSTS